MAEDWDITTNDELKGAVRTETQYGEDLLEPSDLDSLVSSAKRVLALKAGVTDFYSDRGIAVALLGITSARAKGAVENSPVRVENIAGDDVTFRTTDGSSLQLAQYEEMTQLGLRESSLTDEGTKPILLTNDYLTDSSSE